MTPPQRRTRVLVCEDSRTFAAALTSLLERDGDIEVVGVRSNAEAAIADLQRLEPDLITMDIELPGMSGLDAVEQIMSVRPVPILVLSTHVNDRSGAGAAALAAGALEAMGKDGLPFREPDSAGAAAFRRRVRLLSRARVIRHPRARLHGRRVSFPPPEPRRGAAIGMCASTGGPQALATVLSGLPANYPIPILVVQHMAAGFTDGLAKWLDGAVPLPVRLAADGTIAQPGVTLAPEGAHLVYREGGTLALDRKSPAGLHRPSADVLLSSVAEACGPAAVGVVLTGMGRDGAEGIAAIRDRGGLTIAQDEATSAVYGMPKEAARRGAELIVPLGEVAKALTTVALERRSQPR
ncbi:MAG TPA: chemotaxis-specific protein-glutamate methyltransferase CheB [Gaiellaceae bacterium]|nr:chemotaxis-specific protein-glutamate methyltransferase CheB [Gaiellaceae bacterium]